MTGRINHETRRDFGIVEQDAVKRYAVLSMDVEDWYHLDYFSGLKTDRSSSMLDGLDVYLTLLKRHSIRTTFFVLGELAERLGVMLRAMATAGHEIASHGLAHKRPLKMTVGEFADDLRQSKAQLENVVQRSVQGFRAPCFSLDRTRLEEVRKAGYTYDSSRIDFTGHPLYGSLDVSDFDAVSPGHSVQHGFHEFEVSTLPVLGKRLPVSGGGYLRIAPWAIMRPLIQAYVRGSPLYVLYIHPFELSPCPLPAAAARLSYPQRLRFGLGRAGVVRKLDRLVRLLKDDGFSFVTFRDLCEQSARRA
jgi:polysaccharide deacetylase family protein (PEP-CTERM system associated)